ncbi:hypothetical protein DFH09DRAFT_1102890 [Mycena vulgaris]|nr:hypothetical protein DFH09DRAFT_1102890 [Mycena vulgaris]
MPGVDQSASHDSRMCGQRSLNDVRGASEAAVTRATATGSRPAPRGGKSGKRESRAALTHARWSPVLACTPERCTAAWMSHASARVYAGGVRAAPARHDLLTSGGTRARGTDVDAPGATSGTRCARYRRRRAGSITEHAERRWSKRTAGGCASGGARHAPERADATTTPLRTRAWGVAASGPVKPQCTAVVHGVYYSNGRAASTGTFAVRMGVLARNIVPAARATAKVRLGPLTPTMLYQGLEC